MQAGFGEAVVLDGLERTRGGWMEGQPGAAA